MRKIVHLRVGMKTFDLQMLLSAAQRSTILSKIHPQFDKSMKILDQDDSESVLVVNEGDTDDGAEAGRKTGSKHIAHRSKADQHKPHHPSPLLPQQHTQYQVHTTLDHSLFYKENTLTNNFLNLVDKSGQSLKSKL